MEARRLKYQGGGSLMFYVKCILYDTRRDGDLGADGVYVVVCVWWT
jgi:hypothetical protein